MRWGAAAWRLAVALMVCAAITVAARADEPETGAAKAASATPLVGQLLVASSSIGDPRFAETVIYMISHDADGAMGLVVNRAYGEGPLDALLEAVGVESEGASGRVRLQYGGPVEPGRGIVLHSADYSGASTRVVADRVAVSFGKDVLEAIAAGVGPQRSAILLGYAGWGPGQLEDELSRDDWLTARSEESLIFSDDLDSVWRNAMDHAGLSL